MSKLLFRIATYTALAIFLILYLRECNISKTLEGDVEALSGYKDTVMYYEGRNGDLVAYNEALELKSKDAHKLVKGLEEELKELKLKKPQSHTIVRTETRVDSVYVHFTDSIPAPPFEMTFDIDSTWYDLSGRVTNTSLFLDNISLPNTQKVTVGKKSNGFLKRKSLIVAVTNNNPHVNVEGIQNYTFKPQNKKRWYIPFAAGIIGGIALGTKVL